MSKIYNVKFQNIHKRSKIYANDQKYKINIKKYAKMLKI